MISLPGSEYKMSSQTFTLVYATTPVWWDSGRVKMAWPYLGLSVESAQFVIG